MKIEDEDIAFKSFNDFVDKLPWAFIAAFLLSWGYTVIIKAI